MNLFIIQADSDSNWLSCKTISKNLKKSYQQLGKKHSLTYFTFSPQLSFEKTESYEMKMRELAEEIRRVKPDRLIFLEHFPLPPLFLSQLQIYLKTRDFPQILIHVYGDFTYFSKEWVKFLSAAKDLNIHFLVASDAQARLLRYFLPSSAVVNRCFFPLDGNDYYFDEKLRKDCRKKFKIKDDEKVYIYTGRISLQKNVDCLLKEFISLCKQHPEARNKLWIVGGFDDSGAEIFGVRTYEGYLYSKFQGILDKLPENIRSRITIFGQQSKTNVVELLCGADVFCSLSLFHDDDFGMAPAEALATGLPSYLTAWGGYSSFVSPDNSWDCHLLGVKITHLGYDISMSKFRDSFFDYSANLNRHENARKFISSFSVDRASHILDDLLKRDVDALGEISMKLHHYTGLSKIKNQSGMSEYFLPSEEGFYHSMYQNYISNIEG